ncbi:MarR family winged helix-turn-helix transcriptional regulator [Undibacter mobilis]|nr:MarR family winged helix-turn-helix transcriptional regulator [Undibacter mobilis]
MTVLNFAKIEKRSAAAARSRNGADKHEYFVAVAHVRYILRKVFRLIEDKAKELGLESLAHQALLQVYGSPTQELRVSELAERLDIAPAFASNLIKGLVKAKYLKRESDASDARVTILRITPVGRAICDQIDTEVRPHVDYFTSQLTSDERETALSTLMFYVGPGAIDGK